MPAKNLVRINDQATYFHIYNKGVEGRVIFASEADYQVFEGFLKDYLTPQDPSSIKKDFEVHGRTFTGTPHLPKNYLNQVELIAYSLMPDRFDLILHQKTHGSIERFLRSLTTRYSMYFNKKYQRSGALFEGPYKSVQIKDKQQLSNLTASLHYSSNNSSYPEYLGSRNSSWIKPEVVLSLFKNGVSEYKNFVEKEQSKGDQLERSHPERNLASEPDLPSRMPQFLTISTMGFVFLVSFSLWNINISNASTNPPSPTPAVLSETTTTAPSPTPEATSPEIIEASQAAEIEPEPKPEISLRVKIDDGSTFVNIRQKPSLGSEKIGKAYDGDTFEFISLQAGWYEIKLTDGSKGFISAKYAVKEEEN